MWRHKTKTVVARRSITVPIQPYLAAPVTASGTSLLRPVLHVQKRRHAQWMIPQRRHIIPQFHRQKLAPKNSMLLKTTVTTMK